MAHVGVKRFRAGQRKEHAAHHRKGDERICQDEPRRLARIDRFENGGRGNDVHGAEQPDDEKPHHHDRTEQAADGGGPAPLHHEEPDQDRERQRHDEIGKSRRDQLQAFDGGEHGNSRRDDAVAVKQRRPYDAQQDKHRNPRTVRDALAVHQRQQRQDPAFTVVVGAQDQHDVFERHHCQERPEDQRNDPQHVGRGRRRLAGGGEGDSERIERACADIPEDDADRGEREEEGAALVQFAAAGRSDRRLLRRGALGIHGSYPFAHSRRFSTASARLQPHDELSATRARRLPLFAWNLCSDRLFSPAVVVASS